MTSRERIQTTAEFKEPDRVPIELKIREETRELPELQKVVDFVDKVADNFEFIYGIDWGFIGLASEFSKEIIEDVPNEFMRMRRIHKTAAGDFTAITKHNYPNVDSPDFHWERRFIDSLDDMKRLADAPRPICQLKMPMYQDAVERIGDRGMPILYYAHPLGRLVRWANMEEAYIWLMSEPALMHRFLEKANTQARDSILELGKAGISSWFGSYAHEMLIPPWMGMNQFNEWVFPYDKMVNDAIHQIGGKSRSHCHGNSMQFLEHMSEMGIDSTEPLEPPPFGDVNIGEAKRLVGNRMLLSGNVPSQDFVRMTRKEVKEWVRNVIRVAAPGGGFTLKTTGANGNVDPDLDKGMLLKIIENVEAYIEAGLEFGAYPIHM